MDQMGLVETTNTNLRVFFEASALISVPMMPCCLN